MDEDGKWHVLDAHVPCYRFDANRKIVSRALLAFVPHVYVCPKLRRNYEGRQAPGRDSDESG